MKKIVNILFATVVLFSASSCLRDDLSPAETPGEDASQLVLRLNVPGDYVSQAASRALDFASENTVDNVYVLIFNQSNNLVDIRPGEAVVSTPDPNYVPGNQYSATATFTVTVPPSATNSTSKLVVLANAATILSATVGTNSSSSYTGRAYADVMAAIYTSITGQMYPSGGRIPMWGETAQIQIAPGNNNQTITLTRAVVRVDVGVGTPTFNNATKTYSWNGNNTSGAAIPFKLTSVTMVRPNNRYAVVPAQANQGSGGRVSAPTVPAGTTAFSVADSKTNFTFNATNGYLTNMVYLPEADILMGAQGAPNDANHTNRMAVVVGGNYNNSTTTTYYRLDFATGGNLINALRNNIYQFNITSATGPGFATVDDAYAAVSMNMTANVLQWDNNNGAGAIVFDGTNTLAVTPRDTMRLYGNQYTAISPTRDNALSVYTDIPAGWTIDHIATANADGSDGALNPSWIRLSPTSGATNTRTDVTVGVDANTTTASRTANVWIRAGNLSYRVRVVQSNAPAIDLKIWNSTNTQEIDRLIFNAPAGTAPAAQSFNVRWLPATNPATVNVGWNSLYEFPNPGSNPAVADGAPFNGQSIQPGNGTYTYNVSPPAITTAEVAANPFIQKSTRFDFSVNNGYTTMTKGITLTNVNYALLVEPSATATQNTVPANPMQGPWYAQLGGRRFTYNVRSNSTWRISNVVETKLSNYSSEPLIASPGTSGDNVRVNATGTPNTTPGGGYQELFTTSNSGRGNSGYADITYASDPVGRFDVVTQRIFFPSAQFTVYGIVKMGDSNANFYNIFSGTNKQNSTSGRPQHMHPVFNDARNFGTNLNGSGNSATPSSKVFTGPVNVNGVNYNDSSNLTVADINDAVTAKADMLYISGSTKFGDDVAQAIVDNFLRKDKPVFLAIEDGDSFIALWKKVGGGGEMIWKSNSALNGNAPVYQFQSPGGDPIVANGMFGGLNDFYWGCDGTGSIAYWFTDSSGGNHTRNNMVVYSNARNQSGGTDNPPTGTGFSNQTMDNGYTCFRFTHVPLIFAADGGFAGCFNQTDSDRGPALIDTSTNYPAMRGNYGAGTKRNTTNSYFVANVVAWAVQRRTTQ